MRYDGIYKAYVVLSDAGETRLCRIKVSVPEVFGADADPTKLPWARVLAQAMGGGLYSRERGVIDLIEQGTRVPSGVVAIPPIGSTGYVIFEQGDPLWPVWIGSWYGTENEVPSSALRDSVQNVVYPYIMAIQCPWAENMYIRFSKDRQIEISMGGYMAVRLIAETSEGKGDGLIQVSCDRGGVSVEAPTGEIKLTGKKVTISAENDITVRAGRWKTTPQGDVVVDTKGSLRLEATERIKLHSEERSDISSGEKGAIQATAPTVSGFEKHSPT